VTLGRAPAAGMHRDLPLVFLVAALMATSFVFVKLAVPALGAPVLVDARVLAAAAVLALWMRLRGRRLAFGRGVLPYLVLGALNAAIPFTLASWGQLRLDASMAAVLMATVPLFAALLSALLAHERLGGARRLGMMLGLVGVIVLSGWRPAGFDTASLPPLLALLGAACSYAAGSVYARHAFVGVDRTSLTIGNFAAAGLVLAPLALATPPSAPPGLGVIAAMAGLVVLSTAIAFRAYFVLIERAGPTVATSIGFLIPVFGAAWGALFLRETITPTMLVGGAIVLVAMRLVSGHAPASARPFTERVAAAFGWAQAGPLRRRHEAGGVVGRDAVDAP
jgi:drug/metabolite transporter (DMT)-like permease